jgi:hypothetical protein
MAHCSINAEDLQAPLLRDWVQRLLWGYTIDQGFEL